MKKAAIWSMALVGMFLFGFWMGRIPLRPAKTDPEIAEYVNRLAKNVPFTIKIIHADDEQSIALPGGFYYVNSGLIFDTFSCNDSKMNCSFRKSPK